MAKAGGKFTIVGSPRRFLNTELREQERQQREQRRLLQQMLEREMLKHSLAKRLPSRVRKLSGKAWVPVAFERRPDELLAMTITEAGEALSRESETAPDCAKPPLSAGYCTNELRKLGAWEKKPRKSPRQQHPK